MQHVSTAHWSAQWASEVTCLSNLWLLLQEAVTGKAVAGSIPAWAWQASLLTFAAVGLLKAHADMDEERLSPGRPDLTVAAGLKSSAYLGLCLHPHCSTLSSGLELLLPELVLPLDLAYLNCSTSLPSAPLLPDCGPSTAFCQCCSLRRSFPIAASRCC